ncbi:MAG TPA: DUF2169 domain-containing protein [Polyangiaceae bacterium]|nr:DUF2169 domain-containing protein [Polyangiaceae bacterium]
MQPSVDNRTDFVVHPQLLLDRDGEKLAAIVKASFELAPGDDTLELAPLLRARGVRLADIPWGKPDESSIAYPADVCLRKPGTDVIVVACAHAPGGRPVPAFDVRVEVGSLAKSLRVHGLRVWREGGGGLTKARPATEVELRYENAWGGYDDSDPAKIVEEPRNPIGRGKVRDASSLVDQPAPQIEDAAHPITSSRYDGPPGGVGAIGRHWEPRRKYAGTYDAGWLETRCPLPPDDLDDRFQLCAAPGLSAAKPLRGGEQVALLNMLPSGAMRFTLPRVPLEISFVVPGRDPARFVPHLDTVLIDLLATSGDKPPAVEMVWRACVKAPRRVTEATVIVRELEAT